MKPRIHSGFTLIEVLVALAIVAVALIAGLQSTAALTRNAQRQSDMLLAQLCSENALIKLRLSEQMPVVGENSVTCEQGQYRFNVTLSGRSTPNPNFVRVNAQVFADNVPVFHLSTVVGRF